MNEKQIQAKLRSNAKQDPLAAQVLVKIIAGEYTAQKGWEIYSQMTKNGGSI